MLGPFGTSCIKAYVYEGKRLNGADGPGLLDSCRFLGFLAAYEVVMERVDV